MREERWEMKRDGKRDEMRDVGAAGECWGRVDMPSDTNCLLAPSGLGHRMHFASVKRTIGAQMSRVFFLGLAKRKFSEGTFILNNFVAILSPAFLETCQAREVR